MTDVGSTSGRTVASKAAELGSTPSRVATPAVLLPYQQAWHADPSPVRVAEKSRRIGFSWSCAAEATLDAARIRGCDTWYVGYNKEMAIEFIRDAAFWARQFALVATEMRETMFEDEDPEKKILTYSITFASGFRVTALSSRPTNLRGKKGHIILDEAAHHDDLPGLIAAAMGVLQWGTGRVDILSTHFGVDNDFNKLLGEIRAGKRKWSLHRVTFDDALAQGYFKRVCLMTGRTWSVEAEAEYRAEIFANYSSVAEEELLCVPARSGGTYLPWDLIEQQMRPGPVVRLTLEDGFVSWPEPRRISRVAGWCETELAPLLAKLPKDKLHFFGQDFGRVSDRSVIAVGHLAQNLTREHSLVVELCNVPFESQKQILFYVVDRLPRFFGGALDATGNGAYLAEVALQKYGELRIQRVDMTEKWYSENLPPLKAALEDDQLHLVRDADHLLDLSAFKVLNGLPKLPKSKTPTADGQGPLRHGDAGIAYALSYFASRLPVTEYAYEGVPRNPGPAQQLRRQPQPPNGTGIKTIRGGLL